MSTRKHLFTALLCTPLALGLACDEDVEVSANYNVITQVVTGTVKAKGKSTSKNLMLEGVTPDANGCITIEDADCGVIKICGAANGNPVRVTITCSDPLLLQVPEAWTPGAASWSNDVDGTSGALLVEPAASYLDAAEGTTVFEPGMKGLVVMADTVFPSFDGTMSLALDTGGDDPTGALVKAQDIIVAEYFDASDNAIGTPEIAVQLGAGPIDFTAGSTFETMVSADEDEDGADDDICACTSATPRPSLALLALPVLAFLARRRRSAGGARRG